MRNVKKILGLVLALCMALAMATTAFAAQTGSGTGSITVTNAVSGQTYTIYRIFDLLDYDADKGTYSYMVTDAWKDFFAKGEDGAEDGAGAAYIELDANGYMIAWIGDSTAETYAAFAKAALTYAKSENIAVNPETQPENWDTEKTFVPETKTADSTTVTFENLDLGYYLMDTSMGTLCSLSTTQPNAEVQEKNGEPIIAKQVEEDSTGKFGAWDDADIGQEVRFKTTITAQPGAQSYVLHDCMSDGLTYTGITSVAVQYVDTEKTDRNLIANTDYTLLVGGTETGEDVEVCDFEITFVQTFLDTLGAGDSITVEYTAVVNENAVIAGEGNPNETWLDYSEHNHTTHHKTVTYVWELDVFKFTVENNTETPLAGAKFSLYFDSDCTEIVNLVAATDEDGEAIANTYKVCVKTDCDAEHEHITEFTTPDTGYIYLQGFDAADYYLKEIEAPTGYNKLLTPVKVTITSSENSTTGEVSFALQKEGASVADSTIKVQNQTGTILPTTGGIGTTLFYVFGALLAVGAAVLLIAKKRMRNSED